MDLDLGRRLVRRWRLGDRATEPTAGPAPVSTAQRGILVFERLHPGTAVFNLRFAARHTGHLDEGRLDAALAAVLDRHAALRSTFSDGEDGPVRTVLGSVPVTTRWTDLRHLPPERRSGVAREHVDRIVAEPFDLERGPLVRVHGCRLADDERLLVFVAHHLVCDGASMWVLLADLDAAYRGELGGAVTDVLPEPAGPAALDYWRTRLAELPELDLPADRGLPPRPTFLAGSVPVTLSEDLVGEAERMARTEHATLFMVLLAGFQLLLGEHTGQADFAVGSPEAGRSRPGKHGVVGLLADLLVLRADLSGRPTFRDLVRRARATCLAAFDHRGVPFEELVGALAPGRHVDGALVKASLVYHGEWGAPTLAGAALEPVAAARPGLRYEVDLHLWRERGRLWGAWDYSRDVFEPDTAARMARRLPVLLARALAEPDRPVDQLDLLTDADRVLLERWSRGPAPDEPDATLTELFAAQVGRTPDRPAITDTRRELTYRGLDERSNQLAHHLRGLGVGVGDIVGIRLARSVDLTVAMLGILKAGAAYLPLDPSYPADRTEYMLRDSSATAVVTDAVLAALDEQPVSTPDGVPVSPDDLAYVLYTSGSTGLPKGVLLTHRNAVPMVRWGGRTFPPDQLSRVLAATSICFDVSAFEFFVPLCVGGTVVVVDNALSLLADPPEVTMVCAVPSAARALVDAGALPQSTRVVGLAGEAVTGTLADDLYATGHVESVFNLYGPTEDTTYSTQARLLPAEQPPPIGVPLPHGRAYVLDRALRPVPVGAVGELYLAGAGVSLGYLGRPALTASRYVADPAVPGERMYRTGDLARHRSDGALLYLGRHDFQIKIRGQRIELGEIETTLQRHRDVREAVVALRGDRLVGYLTARSPAGIDLDEVRVYLRRTLPVVMVPSSLMVLDALPRTPNGKLDRKALPTPEAPAGTVGGPPRGPDEELVADVWRQVLELDTVGREDDFFDLGGDSLLAGQVLYRLRARAGAGLPLRLVFEHSRLADLAAALPALGTTTADRSPVAPRSPDAEPVLSFDQQRLWLECQFRPNVAYNVHGRQWLRGPLDVAVLERCVRVIIGRHEILRTTFPLVGGQPVQHVADPDPHWRLRIVDLSTEDSSVAAAELLADDQAATSFDLARGPLFDCLLVRRGDTDHLLSMTIHHIVSDGWSVGIVLRELAALYRAGGDVARADLPALPVQYRDYAVWQRDRLSGARLAAQVDHWRDRMAGAPQALAFPTARRRSPAQGVVGGRVRATIGADDVAALHRMCRANEATPFMAMLAALAVVLRRWSGQDDLVVGVPVNTRATAGTDALVGLFVNTVPLRVGLAGDPVFGEVLGRVRQACLDGYVSHGETPFDVLVRELKVVRDPSRTPLFQVVLNMVDTAGEEWRLPGVAVRIPEYPVQPSKFDLNLDVHRRDGTLQLELQYHADRYAAPMMLALLDQVRAMLVAASADPRRGILDYELPGPARTATPAPVPAPHVALTRHARGPRADRVAVVDGDGSWTYRQLAASAARIAGSVEGSVTVVGRRSAGFVATVLGCALSGLPYTVVEPGHHPAGAIVLDPDAVTGAADPGAPLPGGPGADRTTRTRAATDWAVEAFGLTGDDRFAVVSGGSGLLMSAVSSAITSGATLLVADESTAGDPGALVTWLRDNSVTVAYLATPLLRTLTAAGPVLPLLRHAFLTNTGDLTAHDVARVRRLAPDCHVVAVYRPAETGLPLAAYPVPSGWSPATAPLRVPIGTEVGGPVTLLNAAGRPSGTGEVADLHGDLVRRDADHLLEFAGPPSADPLETVAALRDLPDVLDAVVTEHPGTDGRTELTAHVAGPGGTVDLARLRQHLITALPEYLVPRRVVVLERLPLTRDGAYDLTVLPDPGGAPTDRTASAAPAR